jgi:hypothetical protein
MTALTRNPSNPNFLHPNKFQLNFSRLPNIQYFCQSVLLPGVSMSEVPRNTPFVELYSPGDKAIFDALNVTFMVDEDMTAWLEVYDWIRAMTFPTDFSEYRELPALSRNFSRPDFPQLSDATLTLLSSSNNPTFKFKFVDIFPVAVTSFPLSTMDNPDSPITADATFRFSYYTVEKLI